jgi:phosphoenolpyruvate---glycerone phosphotransferase subunit DhaL
MYDTLTAWLRLSAERIHDESNALTALDRAIGDGDHGINMDRGFAAIVATLDETEAPAAASLNDAEASATLLRTAGKRLISTVGGASGPLYGTAFLRAAGAIAASNGRPAEAIVAALEAAAGGVASLGKAAPGEKTMLDALVPAAEAARGAADSGGGLAAVAAAARDAAEAGARATIPMVATKGRASYLGERSVGHQDPGATSSALLLRTLADVASD